MKFGKAAAFALASASLAAALAMGGCASSGNEPSSSAAEGAKQITDVYGRTVEVPADVQTCATVGSAARFVVYAGAQEKLVAVTELDTPSDPARPYTVVWEEMFSGLPTTSNGNHLMETSVDGEAMLQINPEVIISSRSAQECDALQEQLGIPVVGISYQDQIFTDDVYDSIKVVGETLGTAEHAQSVVDQMQAWQADLNDRTANIPESDRPTAYAGAVNYKGAKSFGGTYAQYPPFMAANIVNVADDATDKGSVDVTLEQLGEWDPDFMFLNARNMDMLKKDYANNKAFFDNLTAFKNGNLYSQPAYNMNGTNIELAICDAYFDGATVYPEAFSDVDLPEKYDEIFSVLLGKEYYAQMQSLGLDFTKLSFEG